MEIPVGYAQVNFFFTGAAAPSGAQITLGLDVSGYTGTPTDAAGDVAAAWTAASMSGRYTDDVALTGILVKFGPTETGPSGTNSPNISGAQATASAPPNVSLLYHKETALGGRAGRGRFYLPGVPENAIDDSGGLGGAYVAAGNTEVGNFLNALVAGDLIPVLLHGENSPISLPTPLTDITLDSRVATQRRRLRR